MKDFTDRTVLVTGAARGIGASLVSCLRSRGARVIAVDREHAEGDLFLSVDLTDASSIDAAADNLPTRIDAVACVAGVSGMAPPEVVLRVNFLGLRRFFEACLPRMSRSGAAVFVSSITAHRCAWSDEALDDLAAADEQDALALQQTAEVDGTGSYELSKRVLNHWVLTRLPEWSRRGVRANIVSPGPVTTDLLGDFERSMGKARIDAAAEVAGRHGAPEEVSAVIAFLLSDEARWVNGSEVRVDGGFHALRAAQKRATSSVAAQAR